MTFRIGFAALVTVFGLSACGGSTASDGGGAGGSGANGTGASAGSGGAGASGGSGGSGGGPLPCTSFVPCCDGNGNSVDPVCDANGTVSCPPGSSFPASGICSKTSSCSPSVPCSNSEYCDYPDDRCGEGAKGVCKPRPNGCDLLYAPVCTCNGTQAGNECGAYAGGVDVSVLGNCPPPPDTFACGSKFCDGTFQYCLHSVSDVGGIPDSYSCEPIPAGCASKATCACVKQQPCGDWCTTDGAGNVTLTCPGG